MNAMLDPRIVAASIHVPDLHGTASVPDRIATSSQGPFIYVCLINSLYAVPLSNEENLETCAARLSGDDTQFHSSGRLLGNTSRESLDHGNVLQQVRRQVVPLR